MKSSTKIRSRYAWDAYIRLEPRRRDWPFMRYRLLTLGISLIFFVIALGALLVKGLNFGIDFQGGLLVEVQSSQSTSLDEFRQSVQGLNASSVVNFGAKNEYLLRFEIGEQNEAEQNQALKDIRDFLGTQAHLTIRRAELVGPTIGQELVQQSIWAVLAAMFGIMLYIWLRFEWNFGVAGLIALTHDVVLILGLYALFDIPFSVQTVAAVLAMAGYSINDSVVVFDRVRENLRKFSRLPLPQILDRTLNEVLSRSFMTSFTTLLAILALLLFGGPVLRDFVWALVIGILVGTWSSLVIASPIMLWFPPKTQDED